MNLARELKLLEERPGLVVVLSGPSGVGKDTLLRRLVQICTRLERCVTYTTRAPRPGEVSGVDYNFVGIRDFRRMAESGEFLEYAQVHGHLYGSSLRQVDDIRRRGLDVVLKIDVQGGLTVKRKIPDAVLVFVAPPSLEDLDRRLRTRYTDSEADISKRLLNARDEIKQITEYDYLVVNDEFEQAVDTLCAVIKAERVRIRSNDG